MIHRIGIVPVALATFLAAGCVARPPTPTIVPPPATYAATGTPAPTRAAATSTHTPVAGVTPTPTPTRDPSTPSARFEILVDATQKHQTMEGFGATHLSLVYPGIGDAIGSKLRAQAIEAAYGKVQVSLGNVEGALLESPGSYDQRANDDGDPFHISWSGFQTRAADDAKKYLVDLAAPYGFDDFFIDQKINVRWASPWLDPIRSKDYNRYLDEAGEQVAAGLIYWRDTLQTPMRYDVLFNEPLSGNRELLNGTTQDAVDLVKRVGARLRRDGFANTKFVIPNEETEEKSLATATAILTDPIARQYVGAIGYHPYPYGSIYSSIPNILNTAGQGKPDPSRVAIRNQLRDLGKQSGIPVWMTEVSHGGVDPLSFDALRGRAIQIHDELVYADAAAYFGMNNLWDSVSQREHFKNGNLLSPDNEGTLVFIDTDKQVVYISGMGYAIGHYARWVKRGASRIDAISVDPLIQVTAFEDNNAKRIVLVLINNTRTDRDLNVKANGLTLAGNFVGEQSTAAAAWQSLAPFAPSSSSTFTVRLPALSVTSIAAPIQ